MSDTAVIEDVPDRERLGKLLELMRSNHVGEHENAWSLFMRELERGERSKLGWSWFILMVKCGELPRSGPMWRLTLRLARDRLDSALRATWALSGGDERFLRATLRNIESASGGEIEKAIAIADEALRRAK